MVNKEAGPFSATGLVMSVALDVAGLRIKSRSTCRSPATVAVAPVRPSNIKGEVLTASWKVDPGPSAAKSKTG